MFQAPTTTAFGAAFTTLASQLVDSPTTLSNGPSDRATTESTPAVQLHVPPELLAACPLEGTSFIRLGCLQAERGRIGVAMAYARHHFAMGLFDHGDPRAKAMAQTALKANTVRLSLRNGSTFALATVRLTPLMRSVMDDCADVEPCTVAEFTGAVASMTQVLSKAETYREMGIDPQDLRTVTLSVCMPRAGETSHVELAVARTTPVH